MRSRHFAKISANENCENIGLQHGNENFKADHDDAE